VDTYHKGPGGSYCEVERGQVEVGASSRFSLAFKNYSAGLAPFHAVNIEEQWLSGPQDWL